MQIKIFKICLFDGKRINELYEACSRKEAKIRELDKAMQYKQAQHKGYAKELEKQLREIEDLKSKLSVLAEERDKWVERCLKSEEARKHLGEKLKAATELLEAAEERENMRVWERGAGNPYAAETSSGASATFPVRGEGLRDAEGVGPYEETEETDCHTSAAALARNDRERGGAEA